MRKFFDSQEKRAQDALARDVEQADDGRRVLIPGRNITALDLYGQAFVLPYVLERAEESVIDDFVKAHYVQDDDGAWRPTAETRAAVAKGFGSPPFIDDTADQLEAIFKAAASRSEIAPVLRLSGGPGVMGLGGASMRGRCLLDVVRAVLACRALRYCPECSGLFAEGRRPSRFCSAHCNTRSKTTTQVVKRKNARAAR